MCFSDYDGPEFCTTTYPVAARPHECLECGRVIEPGEPYARVSGKWEGEFQTFKDCSDCARLRVGVYLHETLDEGCAPFESWPPYGGLEEHLAQIDDDAAVAVFEHTLPVGWPPREPAQRTPPPATASAPPPASASDPEATR